MKRSPREGGTKLIDRIQIADDFRDATLDTITWTELNPLRCWPKWEYGELVRVDVEPEREV